VIQEHSIVCLELESRPECLTLIRGMLAAVGETAAFEPELLDDLKTAVSEACNNVVLHAYEPGPGPLNVTLEIANGSVLATVRDHGGGIRHASSPADDRMGVGLAVISALADRAEFLTASDGGTEVRMAFRVSAGVQVLDRGPARPADSGPGRPADSGPGRPAESGPPRPPDSEFVRPTEPPPVQLIGDVVATLSPVALLAAVLGRVARAVAARARFSLDRFSDVYLVTDAIASLASTGAAGSAIGFAIAISTRRLELTIAPLRAGSGAVARRSGSPLARLVDELTVTPNGASESLRLVMIDHAASAVGVS
jgi:serine/threonine-protein kinase RsbW